MRRRLVSCCISPPRKLSYLTYISPSKMLGKCVFRLCMNRRQYVSTLPGSYIDIWRGCIFFLLTFALLYLFTSDLTACLICFSTLHIVGSLLFKLPSIMMFHAFPSCIERWTLYLLDRYGCFPKWWYPQIIHFNRVFHDFHHPFWVFPPI